MQPAFIPASSTEGSRAGTGGLPECVHGPALESEAHGLLDVLPAALLAEVLRHLPIVDLARSSATAAAWQAAVLQVLQRTECVDLIACHTHGDGTGSGAQHLRVPAVKLALTWALSSGRLPSLTDLRVSAWGSSLFKELVQACEQGDKDSSPVLQMKSLCIERDPGLELALPVLLRCCGASLRHLALPKCRHLGDAVCEEIGKHCPGLLTMDASNWDGLTDAGVAALARHCTDLQELRVDGCLRMQDEGLAAVAVHCRRLRMISACGCLRLTDASLRPFEGHPALEAPVFRQCPRVHDFGLLSTCPALTHLDASGCAGVHNEHLRPLLRAAGLRLQSLLLYGCTGLTADIGQDIAVCCPVLQELDVSRIITSRPAAALISPAAAASLAAAPTAASEGEAQMAAAAAALTEAAAALAAAPGDEQQPVTQPLPSGSRPLQQPGPELQRPPGMLSLLAVGIHSLRVLRLEWCKAHDAELCAIVVANPHLQELNLEGLYDITDASLQCIAAHCHDLTDLNIRLCHKLTIPGIIALVAASRTLKHIWLSGVMDEEATGILVRAIKSARSGCTTHW